MSEQLSLELMDLMEHEEVIEQGLASFVDVGLALLAIRDGRKYIAAGYSTFEDYCQRRWKISRPRGYQLIEAARTFEAVSTAVDSEQHPDYPLPASERETRPLTRLPIEERAEAWQEAVDLANEEVDGTVVAAVVERRKPLIVPTGGKGHDGPPHPATYPVAVLDAFRDLLAGRRSVLDPFAGVGTIHQLRPEWETFGIEIEKEWAGVTEHTAVGDARNVAELYHGRTFAAIATSPAYGNRLADAFYNAHDPEGRRTYAFDLGRPLDPDNGAGMAFGDEYRTLHRDVWRAVVDVLEPGGVFLLNCKDFTRDGAVVPVTGWHIGELAALGLQAVDLRSFPAAGLPYTTAKPLSELVIAFRKEGP